MLNNYHTHTFRCGHAVGEEREYVERAAEAGMKVLGFSDHTPYIFRGSIFTPRPGIRMKPEELRGYVESLRALREEYAGRLDIRIGLEAEYYPHYFPATLEHIRECGVEYLIMGQHFLGNEVLREYSGHATSSERLLAEYVDQVLEGLGTGLFSYLAHPDLFNYTGDEKIYEKHYRRLARGVTQLGLPLEINLLGIREGRHYPDERFWQIAAEEGARAVLGADAHDPAHVSDPDSEKKAREMAARCGIEIMKEAELKSII